MALPSMCTVTYVGLIRRIVGCRQEVLALDSGTTLERLLRELCSRHGPELEHYLLERGELAAHATVLLNGRNAQRQGGLAAKLGDGQDHVELVVLGPPAAGG